MVEQIRFTGGTMISAEFECTGNIMTIGSVEIPADTSHIELIHPPTGAVYGVYDGYVTVYRKLEDKTQLSNDGSIWVDPPTPPEPEPEPVDPTPSLEERVTDLEAAVCELAESM